MILLIFTIKLNNICHLPYFIDEESKIQRSYCRRHLGSDFHFHLNWVWATLAAILGKEEFTGDGGRGEGGGEQGPGIRGSKQGEPSSLCCARIHTEPCVSKGDE